MNSQPQFDAPTRSGARTSALALWMLAPVLSVANVEIIGLEDTAAGNVRALLPLTASGCDSARWRIERLFGDADKKIDEALAALGHYEVAIQKTLTWTDSCWTARFDIDPGPPVLIGKAEILVLGDGAPDPLLLPKILVRRPTVGDVLHHGAYEDYKSALLRAAVNAGYFDAEFSSHSVTVDREARTAEIQLHLDSGNKYRFGELSFTEGILRKRLLQGYTDIRAGDPYSAQSIGELYEVLNGSSYFQGVSIDTEPLNTAEKIVPLNVNLTPAKRRLYSIGGGFATDTGPHGRLGYTDRRINENGHQFESKLFASPVRSQLNATYRWPKNNPRNEWFSVVTGAQHEDTDTSTSDTYKLGVMRTRALGNSWLETRYIDYEVEESEIADQKTSSQLLIFGDNWEREKGRALSRVLNGHRLNVDVRGASDALGSDTNFLQLQANARLIHSFGERTRILARVTLAITSKNELSELPASVRYFAGGDRSIRGYEFESLGPINEDGNVIGGSHLVEASIEIDRLIRDRWAVALFVDTGSAFNDSDFELSTGVGLGLRWYSPIGPIRVDFAHPLDDPGRSLRLHISLGPDL